jgi:uncharacterized membrane protein YeiH
VLVALLFFTRLLRLKRTFFLFDTLGISFFTILGVEKALSLGVRPEIAAIMGMFTAVMGGVIRDTLANEMPVIFRKEIYATACLVGAVFYLLLDHYAGFDRGINLLSSIAVIIVIRILAVKYNLALPGFKKPPH